MIQTWLGGALFAAVLATSAPGADFHQTFEARCFSCHGHAGEFARMAMTEVDGDLRGIRTGREVAALLRDHAGGLSEAESSLFVDVFTAQIQSDGFYQERCEICHDRAYELARLRLIVREGQLVGRYSNRDMTSFLPAHARMTVDEADRMLKALTALRSGAR